MAAVHVQAARIPDRDRMFEMLDEQGIDVTAEGELGLEARPGDRDRLIGVVERAVLEIGAPFVPVEHDGVIYIRPPVS